MLAAAHVHVDEVWMGKPKEMFMLYLAQYFPDTAKSIMKSLGKKTMEATLTKLLRGAFGGSSRTTCVVAASPDDEHAENTV